MNKPMLSTRSGWLERVAATLTEVVFPPVCAGCGRLGPIVCDSCAAAFVPVGGSLCQRCGRVLDKNGVSTNQQCHTCAAEPPLLREARAPLLYVEPAISFIHRLKYDGYFALAEPLATIMAARWPAWSDPPDLIVPIPLHARRQRQRGFNQSALLSRHLGRALGVACDEDALRRHRHTQPQIKLSPTERRDNVAGAFTAAASRLSGKSVLLVDDVYTTGATMAAAAEALTAAGATAVSGYCLARVS